MRARGYRADLSVGLGDLLKGKGRLTLYTQAQGAGYSAPGLASLTDTDTFGGTLAMPLTERLIAPRATGASQEQGLETTRAELDLGYQLTDRWSVSTGVRSDKREDERRSCR